MKMLSAVHRRAQFLKDFSRNTAVARRYNLGRLVVTNREGDCERRDKKISCRWLPTLAQRARETSGAMHRE
jgi:hypothetical protein